jgi:hypothetical protein
VSLLSGVVPDGNTSNPSAAGYNSAPGHASAPPQIGVPAAERSHSLGMRPESEPHGMSSMPPANPAMFDPSAGTGAPLLSMATSGGSMPNPVLRPPPLGSFSMGLPGTCRVVTICSAGCLH